MYYPGTQVESKSPVRDFFEGLFVGGGIAQFQLRAITGLEASTIQNWINRNWLTRPVGKKYSAEQLARILIINILKNTMSFSEISSLLYYVNGETETNEDDIVEETTLYFYICDILLDEHFTLKGLNNRLIEALNGYKEVNTGAYKRLQNALKIICLSFVASSLMVEAKTLLKDISA